MNLKGELHFLAICDHLRHILVIPAKQCCDNSRLAPHRCPSRRYVIERETEPWLGINGHDAI